MRFDTGWRRGVTLAALLLVAACGRNETAETPEPRPVRTVTVARQSVGESVLLTGHIQAAEEASMAFRIGGRMTERLVNIGDHVDKAQVIAKLDPQNEVNALRSTQTALAAASAALTQSRAAFERQRILLGQGHTTRAQFDLAEKALRTTEAQVDDADIQKTLAALRVSYTILQADAPGTVIARGAEPGEVVQPGQMIVQLARKGGRDAVFDVPAQVLRAAPTDPDITVRLTDDPSITATARVREVAPQADPVTRTFEVKAGLGDPPAKMLLGSTVTGTIKLDTQPVIEIPAAALTESNREPAVWVVDPKGQTVSIRRVELLRHDPGTVTISSGLEDGDIVVTAGVQALHPGQKVRLVGPAA